MGKLTEQEIRDKAEEAVEVGTGLENGVIVQKVHKGHIVDTYAETRKYSKGPKTKAEEK